MQATNCRCWTVSSRAPAAALPEGRPVSVCGGFDSDVVLRGLDERRIVLTAARRRLQLQVLQGDGRRRRPAVGAGQSADAGARRAAAAGRHAAGRGAGVRSADVAAAPLRRRRPRRLRRAPRQRTRRPLPAQRVVAAPPGHRRRCAGRGVDRRAGLCLQRRAGRTDRPSSRRAAPKPCCTAPACSACRCVPTAARCVSTATWKPPRSARAPSSCWRPSASRRAGRSGSTSWWPARCRTCSACTASPRGRGRRPGRRACAHARRRPAAAGQPSAAARGATCAGLAALEIVQRPDARHRPARCRCIDDPGKRVASIVPGDPPYVVTVDGTRYFEGALLPTGHRIAGIEERQVVLEIHGVRTPLVF